MGFRRIILTALALVAATCIRQPAGAAGPTPLRIGALPIDPAGQVFFAQDEGFFKEHGLDASITMLSNATAITAATVSGAVDVGVGTVPGVTFAHLHGIPITFVTAAIIYTGPIGNVELMVLKNAPIHDAADLNGKTIAVSGLRDMNQFETQAFIDRNGGSSSSVHFVEMPFSQMGAALAQGRVDAAAVIEPFITGSRDVARELANLSDTIGGPYLVGGWVATESWIKQNPETLRRFVAAMREAARWANAHPDQASAVLLRYTKISPAVAAAMARPHYDDAGTIDVATVQRPIDMLTKYGAIPGASARDIIAFPTQGQN
jgi:NitT/TauT family transport system substrate-binding protein